MTLTQVKNLLIGVLRGWFTNKTILDKIGENNSGEVTFNGVPISNSNVVTDDQITAAITATIQELNTQNNQDNQEQQGE